ncbi:unnamed protein product [Linum trigynum]|uniref:Uncharacterized protein n=1 Tax=Linum trigynum TaxID=586398 RepID=A0AAV2CU19_9ROSI
MDAYQQHRPPPAYLRPPLPPSTADPNHFNHHHNQQPPPPPPPVHPQQQAPWYSNQFQFHPPPHSASPPPHQWAPPPPPSYPPSSYPAPPHHYPSPQNQQFPPPPPPQQNPYPQQEWGKSGWVHHQAGFEYQAHNNTEDWAARAREWAAKKVEEDQHPQSQFNPVGRIDEQGRYQDQYPQNHYQEVQQQAFPAPQGYQQFTVPVPHYYQPSPGYSVDGQLPYAVPGAISTGAPTTSPSVHEQEVPSSYSSFPGTEETVDAKEIVHAPLPVSSAQEPHHHMQPSPVVRPSDLKEPPFAYGNQGAGPITNLSDQPLEFAPGFGRNHDSHVQSSYVGAVDSWTHSAASSSVYHSVVPPGSQYDPSVAMPSASGHAAPPFGSFTGSSFQSTLPSNGAPFGLGVGGVLHPSSGYAGDGYGVHNISDRPKKASVPNWLKEEIIKTASVITRSSVENPKEGSLAIVDEEFDESFRKGDLGDNKSIDSSRSTEEEDDDEDEAEAARTAAVNLEIKRILTEVLSKVTDELFDEIATKVLDEDNQAVEVDQTNVSSNYKVSSSPSVMSTHKASADVVVPRTVNDTKTEGGENSSASSPTGNVLGLANYSSDEDDDDEIRGADIGKLQNGSHNSGQKATPQENILISDFIGEGGQTTKQPADNAYLAVDSITTSDQDNKTSLSSKDLITKEAAHRSMEEKVDDNNRRQDKRHSRTERSESQSCSKMKTKDRGDVIGERGNEPESRRKSSQSDAKDDSSRKRERAKEKKEDRGRHKSGNESSRSKRRRSSSVSSKGRHSKDDGSSDEEGSDDSKRRQRSRRQLSPSPVRSKRRQVSRSPHSKHSQRRHSPYSSSLETTRGRRSRSKSPARRHR